MQQILCEISAADTENIFYNPLPCELLPNYKRVVKRPISLTTIAAYIAATTTTTFVGINNEGESSTSSATEVGEEELLLRARQHQHLATPYTWQAFEDDLVCMLTNCIAYNKIGSHAYVLAVNLLQKLPELFALYAVGQHVYSRVGPKKSYRTEKGNERAANPTETSSVAAASGRHKGSHHASRGGAATATTTTIPNALSVNTDKIKSTSSSSILITDNLLKQEALMLHFCALLGSELAGSLASVLLTSPINAASVYYAHSLEYPTPLYDHQQQHANTTTCTNGFVCVNSDGTTIAAGTTHQTKTKEKEAAKTASTSSSSFSFMFAPIPNHLIPRTVEELRQQVMRHAFPSLGAFLRTVSLILAFATACCTDEEAVDILSKFHKKIDHQCVIFSECFPSVSFSTTSSTNEAAGKGAAEEEGNNSKSGSVQEHSRVAVVIDKAANKKSQISSCDKATGIRTAFDESNENDNAISKNESCSSSFSPSSSSLMALSLQEAIASTAQALRPVCCEDIAEEAERDPLVASAIQNIIGKLVGGSAASYSAFSSTPSKQQQQQQKAEEISASSSSSSAPKSASSSLSSYEQTIVNRQDAILRSSVMALIASLAVADTTGSFHRPFLFKEYLDLIKKPCDLYTMKIKAVLGHYTYPFVRHLLDTRKRRRQGNGGGSVTPTSTTALQSAETRAKNEDFSTPCASILPQNDVDNTNNNDNDNAGNTTTVAAATNSSTAVGSQRDADANQQTPQRPSNTKESPTNENGAGEAIVNADDDEIHIDYTILDSVRAAIRADLDIMVDNCTYYNGPDHQLSRLVTEMRRSFASEARKCGL